MGPTKWKCVKNDGVIPQVQSTGYLLLALNLCKYGIPFYLQYLSHWPEYFQVAESPNGQIMGYSKCSEPCVAKFLACIKIW